MNRSQSSRRGSSGRDRPPSRGSDRRRDASSERREKGPNSAGERLQKVLAAAGVGSRRDCEELITEGRVEVDRKIVTELGTRVDPVSQEIRVDGEMLKQPKRMYFAVNKPMGVVTTNYDPSGRPRVIDLVPTEERLFAVGRLDRSSEGLILVTNDGEFANRLTHPRYGVEKTYLVRVAGSPSSAELDKLRRGVHLSDGFCRVDSIKVKSRHKQSTDMVIVLGEGRNREIRRILARVGHKVVRLKRIGVGSLKLGEMPLGAWRKLMPAEINGLMNDAKLKRRQSRARPAKAKAAGAAPPGSTAGQASSGTPAYERDQSHLRPQDEDVEEIIIDDLEDAYETDEVLDFPSDEAPGTKVPRGDVIEYVDEEFDEEFGTEAGFTGSGGLDGEEPAEAAPSPSPSRPMRPVRRREPTRPDAERAGRSDRPAQPRKSFGGKRAGKRPFGDKSRTGRPAGEKPKAGKPAGDFRRGAKSAAEKAKSGGKVGGGKPNRGKPFGSKAGKPKKKGRR